MRRRLAEDKAVRQIVDRFTRHGLKPEEMAWLIRLRHAVSNGSR